MLLCRNAANEYKRKINEMHSNGKRSLITIKLEKSVIAILGKTRDKAHANLTKLTRRSHLTQDQYMIHKDNARDNAHKCETRIKHLEVSLYREKEKLAIAESQKQWISDQLQIYLQMLHDAQCMLINLKSA